jgi:hypothetical protein
MALDIDTEANNENLDGLDAVALDIDTEASNETEDFAVQFGQNIDFVGNADSYSTFDGNLGVDYSSNEADIVDTGNRSDTFQTTWTP